MRVHDPMIYDYETFLPFERDFDVGPVTMWMKRNWSLSILLSAIYVFVVFTLQHVMRHRHKYELRRALTVWNVALAIFSGTEHCLIAILLYLNGQKTQILADTTRLLKEDCNCSTVGAARMAPEFFRALLHPFEGPAYSVCNNSYAQGVTAFWATLFMASKLVELGDTVFVVLRKQQLIFLHWYHHVTVMVYTWYSFPEHTASGRWFITMNFTVHAFMYSYYACRAMGFRHLPRSIPWAITLMQLAQMCVGCAVSVVAFSLKTGGHACHQSFANLKWSLVMYFTYFALFAHFFWRHYYTTDGKFTSATSSHRGQHGHEQKHQKRHNSELLTVKNGYRKSKAH